MKAKQVQIIQHIARSLHGLTKGEVQQQTAEAIYAAVAPLVAKQERERCAQWHDERAASERSLAQSARKAGRREAAGHHANLAAEHRYSAAAIRALSDQQEKKNQ